MPDSDSVVGDFVDMLGRTAESTLWLGAVKGGGSGEKQDDGSSGEKRRAPA